MEQLDPLERLFRAAQEHPPEERSAFLDAACAGEPGLRRELESLLAADREAEREAFLDVPPAWADDVLSSAGELPPRQAVGPYALLQRLGHGGMGDVYLARRDEPFRRYVALKIIRRGMDTGEVLARFEMERQILASLSHPHIARLLDGGVTLDGLPYFAMEYVEGTPINVFCDEHRLSIETRLKLFQQVCQTVHYAHQNLVVHRDLKPSNILVTNEGVPKLLDFGIAKLLNPNMSPVQQPVTRAEARVMTPEYASPEQIRGEVLSTATDVYSLGVIFYELLTGRRPFQSSELTTEDLRQAVCKQDPERPSTRVRRTESVRRTDGTTQTVEPGPVSEARDTSVERLRRRLRGDLDNIVLKALRKEVPRRYGSAEQLAEDIGRYLAGRPVLARANTIGYQVRKFVGRHRAGVAAALAVLVALLAGLGVALWQADEARQERDRAQTEAQRAERARLQAETVTDFLMGLFQANDPSESHGDELTARELLARGRARAEHLSDEAAVQAQLLSVIGQVYQSLGQYDRAQPLLEQALSLRRTELGDDNAEVAASLSDLGFVLYLQGKYGAAEPYLRDALAMRRRLPGPEHLDVAESLTLLAALLVRRGDYDAAEPLYREALATRRAQLGAEHPDVATSLNNLALLLRLQGDYEGAETLLHEALAQWRRFLGEDHPYVAAGLNNLGHVHAQRGEYQVAERYHREALTLRQQLLGDNHPDVARTMTHLATVLRHTGRYEGAEALYRQSLAVQRAALGAHPDAAQTLNNLALLLHRQRRYDEAEQLYRQALEMLHEVAGEHHPDVAATLENLARLSQERGDLDEAEDLFRRALAMRRTLLGNRHPDVARTLVGTAGLQREKAAYAEAEAMYEEALAILQRQFGDDSPPVQTVYRDLAALYDAWPRPADAARYRALLTSDVVADADGAW